MQSSRIVRLAAALAVAVALAAGSLTGPPRADANGVSPPNWFSEPVDSPREFWTTAETLAVDASGVPHLLYGYDRLYHAWNAGSGWQTEVVDARRRHGRAPSATFDAAGTLHVAYGVVSDTGLFHASLPAGGSWTIEQIAAETRQVVKTSLDVGTGGSLHVAYEAGFLEIRYATNVSGSWVTEDVTEGESPSIAVAPTGTPYIACTVHAANWSGQLGYADRASGSWSVNVLDSVSNPDDDRLNTGTSPALDIDAAGNAHLVWVGEDPTGNWSGPLRYATGPASWPGTTGDILVGGNPVLSVGIVGDESHRRTSIAVDGSGGVHAGFLDSMSFSPGYLHLAGGTWEMATFEDGDGTPAVGVHGTTPHVAFVSSNTNFRGMTLDHATGGIGAWTRTEVDRQGRSGRGLASGVLADDTPVVVYYSSAEKESRARFAYRSAGTWHVQELATNVPDYRRMGLDVAPDGPVHLVYPSFVPSELRWATGDGRGGAWTTEVVAAASSVGGCDVVVDDAGRPHVLWCDNSADRLRHAVRTAANTWNAEDVTPITVLGDSVMAATPGDGTIHVAWIEEVTAVDTVRYARLSGGTWTVEDVTTTSGDEEIALCVPPGGSPTIAFTDDSGTTGDKLVLATRGTGGWTREDVPGPGARAAQPEIRADRNGDLCVAFLSLQGLTYGHRYPGGGWTFVTADRGSAGGPQFETSSLEIAEFPGTNWVPVVPGGAPANVWHPSLTFDTSNRPRIFWWDFDTADLMWVSQDVPSAFGPSAQVERTGGTASQGSDFALASTGLSWGIDDTGTKFAGVDAIQDAIADDGETVVLRLASFTGAGGLGAVTDTTLTIRDGGAPPDTTIREFLFPSSVKLVRNAKDAAKNVLTVTGLFHTGPGVFTPAAPATFTIGGREFAIPAFAPPKKGAWRFVGGGLDLTLTPSKAGTSKGAFKATFRGDLGADAPADGVLALRYVQGSLDAAGSVRLAAGRFSSKKDAAARGVAPAVRLVSMKAKLGAGAKDTLTLVFGLHGAGAAPAVAPDVVISAGPELTVVIDGEDLNARGATWRGAKLPGGVKSVVIDYAKGLATFKLAGVELGDPDPGSFSADFALTIGGTTWRYSGRITRAGSKLVW